MWVELGGMIKGSRDEGDVDDAVQTQGGGTMSSFNGEELFTWK